MTDEIVLSKERGAPSRPPHPAGHLPAQGAAPPGNLATSGAHRLDADLTVAEEQALLDWLDDDGRRPTARRRCRAARRLAGVLANLPRRSSATWRRCSRLDRRVIEAREQRAHALPHRRGRTLPTSRSPCAGWRAPCTGRYPPARVAAAAGRPGPDHARNMRFDGIPFLPVTVAAPRTGPASSSSPT